MLEGIRHTLGKERHFSWPGSCKFVSSKQLKGHLFYKKNFVDVTINALGGASSTRAQTLELCVGVQVPLIEDKS